MGNICLYEHWQDAQFEHENPQYIADKRLGTRSADEEMRSEK